MATSANTPRILVADGDPSVLELAKEILASHECEVVIASNGESALHLAATSVFDLCILGSDLPGTNGIEVCVRLRELPHTSALPLLVLTPDSNSEANDALGAGASDVLNKCMIRGLLWHRVSLLLLISKLSKETQSLRDTLPAPGPA